MVSTKEFKRLKKERDELVKEVCILKEKLLNYTEDKTECDSSPIVELDNDEES